MTSQKNSGTKGRQFDLFWISAIALFIELIVIRWMSSEIRAFSIFRNFPLIACYVGLGLGFMKDKGDERLFKLFPLLFMLLVVVIDTSTWTSVSDMLMPSMRIGGGAAGGWWDATHPVAQAASHPTEYTAISIAVFFAIFVLVAAMMAGLGQRLGKLFDDGPPLQSYLFNLLGSTAGIATFSLLSYLSTPPLIWIAVGCLAASWIFRENKVGIAVLVTTIALVAFIPAKSIFATASNDVKPQVLWSPYHRVELAPLFLGGKTNQIGYEISVNKAFFQQPLNLSDAFLSSLNPSEQQRMKDFRLDQYELPYQFITHPKKVLILGAGTGNDVASALKLGVEQIDAVEIDPMMIELGRKIHPEHPYDSPKVHVYINDARAFLRQHQDQYDLVITAFLDSHAVAGNSLSVRLDDYVYTTEGMHDALSHVRPGGLYSVTYCAVANYLSNRLISNMRLVAAESKYPPPLILNYKGGAIWHLFAPVTAEMMAKLPALQKYGYNDSSAAETGGIKNSTDDWPFLYLNTVSFDPLYLAIVACILLLSWAVCGASIRANRSAGRWQLFFLGSAFMLLELAIIDRLSLVFGTTWIVNSICIFSVLTAIISANILIIKNPKVMPMEALYAGLIISLAVLYAVPVQTFNSLGMWVGGGAASLLSVIPVFFAGMIFSTSFANETKPRAGLAFNMFGAVIGGLCEYVGTYTGIRSLLLVAAFFYIVSFLFWKKSANSSETSAKSDA